MARPGLSTECFNSQGGNAFVPDGVGPLLSRCLSPDLEVGVQGRRIHAYGGVRPETGHTVASL